MKKTERKEAESAFWDTRVRAGEGNGAPPSRSRPTFRRNWYREANHYLQDNLLAHLPARVNGDRVLFIGCGTSSVLTKDLAARGAQVWCIDISHVSVRQLMAHPFGMLRDNVHGVVADAEQLPFADRTFDAVVGKAIVHHLNIASFIRELRRICAPGALIVFSEPLGTNPLINLFRWLTPSLRVSSEHPLKPGDVECMRRYCDDLSLEFHMLFAMTSFPAFYLGLLGVGRFVFRVGCQIDRWLFTVVPPSRWLAWSVTLVGRVGSQNDVTSE
jgi:SAM-dependent methyltransferase